MKYHYESTIKLKQDNEDYTLMVQIYKSNVKVVEFLIKYDDIYTIFLYQNICQVILYKYPNNL